ncbi:hypothetical protein LGZ99_08750 [Photorhabdus temperata]|uniref:Uncharacterized protein n=1 Tax=Photorhabdus temperata subsp. temperata Meg1 TaxID=1393735 RepID=A0A081RZJ5_PHOTE|nr:hypothetical protein [Photorhabdus temperata]KER04098.1 hypothetical protein MEG1DRAFT_01212 [Photorhabdus temperata subsp. temperata Meg1]MCT8347293.1 hypothetical protein [Photorhabdus temperata]
MGYISEDLFTELLLKESGLDPNKSEIYKRKLDINSIYYFDVSSPGNLVRDINGKPRRKNMTYREYFEALGIADISKELNTSYLASACYRVVNAWGFIGIQIGESALYSLGVYIPKKETYNEECLPCYYDHVFGDEVWSNGRKIKKYTHNDCKKNFFCTSVNEWKGLFTGKYDIHSLEDIFIPYKQKVLIYNIWKYGVDRLCELLRLKNKDLSLLTEHMKGIKDLPTNITESSLLAAIHLLGPYKIYRHIISYDQCCDETGTTLDDYLIKFSGLSVVEYELLI